MLAGLQKDHTPNQEPPGNSETPMLTSTSSHGMDNDLLHCQELYAIHEIES